MMFSKNELILDPIRKTIRVQLCGDASFVKKRRERKVEIGVFGKPRDKLHSKYANKFFLI